LGGEPFQCQARKDWEVAGMFHAVYNRIIRVEFYTYFTVLNVSKVRIKHPREFESEF